jgi:hypothetical protein
MIQTKRNFPPSQYLFYKIDRNKATTKRDQTQTHSTRQQQQPFSTMGNDFSSPLDVCGTNPHRDTTSDEDRKRRRRDWDNEAQASTQFLCNLLEFESLGETTPRVHTRSVKKHVYTIEQEDGNHTIIHPRTTCGLTTLL